MPRLQEGVQPTKAEVALFTELKRAKATWPEELPDGTGPREYPLVDVAAQYRARRAAEAMTRAIGELDAAGAVKRSDLALEGLLHALAADGAPALRQALLEEAALLLLWVEDIDHR